MLTKVDATHSSLLFAESMERRKAFPFRTSIRLLIAGPSGCGKTLFTAQLLLDNVDLFDKELKSIHYCYGSWQKGFERHQKQGIKFHEGIPEKESLPKWFPEGGVLVLDDLRDSHLQGITVLYLCQDLFPDGKFAKTMSRNAHCIVTFKNPRDELGIRNLLLQSFPTRWQGLER